MFRRLFRNRWVRGTAITVLVLLIVVTLVTLNAYYTLRHRGEQHQQQVLAELDASDPGWRFEQIEAARQAALPPAEKNVIEQAVKVADRIPIEQYREWQKEAPPSPDRFPPPGDPLSVEEVAYARKLTVLCRDLIPEARELRHLTGGMILQPAENPLAITFPHLDKVGQVDVLLRSDAAVSAADGKIDDALDDVLAILALARGLDDAPFLVVQLFRLRYLSTAVRVIERTLRQGEATDAKLAEVQAALAEAAKVRGFVTALRGERAVMTRMADLLQKDPGQADGLMGGGSKPPKAAVAVAVSALLPETHARYLELTTRAIAVAEKPPGPDRNAEFAQIEADLKADTSLEGEALRQVFPAVERCYEADVRAVTLSQAATACVEYARRRPLDKGSWVGFLFSLPSDPYTGNRFRFKQFDDGIAVYSTGPDKTDDGGTNLHDGGTKAGSDWGVRLYDVKHRQASGGR